MKAIPTVYCGTKFRSRLEADWAATMDSVGLEWQYEIEGFQLSDGSWYLPDFYLPSAKAWMEVKGDHDERVGKFETFAADLWRESGASTATEIEAPLVLLARAPRRHPEDATLWRNMVGVMGHGKRYSVTISQCPNCNQVTVIALWQQHCRGCGFEHEDPIETWLSCSADILYSGFTRVTRW